MLNCMLSFMEINCLKELLKFVLMSQHLMPINLIQENWVEVLKYNIKEIFVRFIIPFSVLRIDGKKCKNPFPSY